MIDLRCKARSADLDPARRYLSKFQTRSHPGHIGAMEGHEHLALLRVADALHCFRLGVVPCGMRSCW